MYRLGKLAGDHNFRAYAVEGDSQIPALDYLKERAPTNVRVLKYDTGKPRFGSVVDKVRFRALADTANAGVEAILEDDWADLVAFIDSDIIYPSYIFDRLLAHGKDITAPLVMAGGAFYDIWGFRTLNNKGFPPDPRWLYEHAAPIQIGSAGAFVVFPMEGFRQGARFGDEAIVSLCKDMRELGYEIWCDPTIKVYHPVPGGPLVYEMHQMQYG